MKDKLYTCENKGCTNQFVKATHNQKYCSDECCKEATNQKIRDKNQEKKDRLSGKKRICKNRGCNTVLSRYQESNVCDVCTESKKNRDRKALLEMIKNVSG